MTRERRKEEISIGKLEEKITKLKKEIEVLEKRKTKVSESVVRECKKYISAFDQYIKQYNLVKQGIQPIELLRRKLVEAAKGLGIEILDYKKYYELRESGIDHEQIYLQFKATSSRTLNMFRVTYKREKTRIEKREKLEEEVKKLEEKPAEVKGLVSLKELADQLQTNPADIITKYVKKGYYFIPNGYNIEEPTCVSPENKISMKLVEESIKKHTKDRIEAGKVINRSWWPIHVYKNKGDLNGIVCGRLERFFPIDIEEVIERKEKLMNEPRLNKDSIKWLLGQMVEKYNIKDRDINEAINKLGIEGKEVKTYKTKRMAVRYTGRQYFQIKDFLKQKFSIRNNL